MANIAKKYYRDSQGAMHRSPPDDVQALVIQFMNGEDVELNLSELSDKMIRIAAAHGLAQKLGDTYAGADDVIVAHGLAEAMAQRVRSDEWNIRGEGGAQATLLAQALAEVAEVTLAEAINKVQGYDKEAKKELEKHPQVAAVIARIQQERAEAKAAKLALAAQNAPPITL